MKIIRKCFHNSSVKIRNIGGHISLTEMNQFKKVNSMSLLRLTRIQTSFCLDSLHNSLEGIHKIYFYKFWHLKYPTGFSKFHWVSLHWIFLFSKISGKQLHWIFLFSKISGKQLRWIFLFSKIYGKQLHWIYFHNGLFSRIMAWARSVIPDLSSGSNLILASWTSIKRSMGSSSSKDNSSARPASGQRFARCHW